MRILVVDDDPDLSLLMKLFLTKNGGHEVDTQPDGRAAVELLRETTYDMVVLDWNMPHLDGLGLCDAIRHDLGLVDLPLLMVTAVPDHATALRAGIDMVMSKPFSSATLVSAVADLAARGPRREASPA